MPFYDVVFSNERWRVAKRVGLKGATE